MEILDILFGFEGRIKRLTFWPTYLPCWVAYIVLAILLVMSEGPVFLLSILGLLLVVFILFAICAKRWHDLGMSGWNSIFLFIPLLGSLLLIFHLGLMEGNYGD